MTYLWSLIALFDKNFWSNHFLYFAGLTGAVIVILIILIIRRIDKDVREMKDRQRYSASNFMKETSKRKPKERKKLKF